MSTVGATAGNIIAAIITTQTVAKKPRLPRAMPGIASIPPMRSFVTSQAATASASSAPSRTSRARSSRTDSERAPTRAASTSGHPQSGYSSLRQERGSSGCGFGVRSSNMVKCGATNGSGAITVYVW